MARVQFAPATHNYQKLALPHLDGRYVVARLHVPHSENSGGHASGGQQRYQEPNPEPHSLPARSAACSLGRGSWRAAHFVPPFCAAVSITSAAERSGRRRESVRSIRKTAANVLMGLSTAEAATGLAYSRSE